MMKGYFISIEGPDGAGKSTQALKLVKYFKDKGYQTVLTREPGGTNVGEQIRQILLDPDNKQMDFKTEVLLYAASRAQLLKEVIIPSLNEGKIVICDRFVDSSIAYQGYGRDINLEMVIKVNQMVVQDYLPDLTILLKLPVEIGHSRIRANNKVLDRMEKEKMDFHRKVLAGFDKLALTDKRYKVVAADRKEEEVFQDIIKVVEKMLQGGV
jgi:dTMP kinase